MHFYIFYWQYQPFPPCPSMLFVIMSASLRYRQCVRVGRTCLRALPQLFLTQYSRCQQVSRVRIILSDGLGGGGLMFVQL